VVHCNLAAYGRLLYCIKHRNQFATADKKHIVPAAPTSEEARARAKAQRVANKQAADAIAALSGSSEQPTDNSKSHARNLSQQQIQQQEMHKQFKKRMANRCMYVCMCDVCVCRVVRVCVRVRVRSRA